jgi:hypothetical protein
MARCIGVSEDVATGGGAASRIPPIVSPSGAGRLARGELERAHLLGPHLGVRHAGRGNQHGIADADADVARAAQGQPVGQEPVAVADELLAGGAKLGFIGTVHYADVRRTSNKNIDPIMLDAGR